MTEPQGFFDFGPHTGMRSAPLSDVEIQLIAASALISHRYEQLRIARDLLASWFTAVRLDQVTTSALLSRTMTEFGAEALRDLRQIERSIDGLSYSDFVDETRNLSSNFMNQLYQIRYAGRLVDYGEEALRQPNILGAIDKLPSWIRTSYNELSEICHPNAQATAVFWSISKPTQHAFDRVKYITEMELAPTPFKIQISAGPYILAVVLEDLATFFWRLACCIAQNLSHVKADDRAFAGIPEEAKRNEPCFCGSGEKTKRCLHPSIFQTSLKMTK